MTPDDPAAPTTGRGGLDKWGEELYGDPCRECGYRWSTSLDEETALVRGLPQRYAELLDGHDATRRHPDLAWSAGAYVCHVTDNLRIWAERLAGATAGDGTTVPGYDERLLGDAREYNLVPVAGALWSLARAARDWIEAVELAAASEVALVHAGRGPLTVPDVARANAHDAYHHAWDIRRTLA
jgi:hypothetical protein